ncbi:MAG: DUF1385 domain-containing protein [Christensenellales bacterium]
MMCLVGKGVQEMADKPSIGGQAVIEGVMMKAPERVVLSVRKPDGTIETRMTPYTPISKRNWFFALPVVRGVVNFVDMMALGVRTITLSAELAGEEPGKPSRANEFIAKKTKKSADDIMVFFAVLLSILLSVGLFILLPSFLTGLLRNAVSSTFVLNILEGFIRLSIFLAYLLMISLMKDIRRVFMYHGAEHKVVNCYEQDMDITLENAKKASRLHARCGTNYLFLVIALSILVFSFLGFRDSFLLRIALRLLLLPLVAGLAYEVLKLAAKSNSLVCRIIRAPGIALQRMTTREPEDDMLEVAMTAFITALTGVLPESQTQKEQTTASAGGISGEEPAGDNKVND